jgi:hypothetical protein
METYLGHVVSTVFGIPEQISSGTKLITENV